MPSAPQTISSWGMVQHARAEVRRPRSADDVCEVFLEAQRRGLAIGVRGGGKSYGDAAMIEGGLLLDTSHWNRILEWDPESGRLRAEPGVTIRQAWERVLPDAWWPPVVSGTMFVTLGGAASMNIHGKNAYRLGPIGDHIQAFEILLPNGDRRRCTRDENAELFHAAIGGFGVLGVFTWIEIQMKPIESGLLEVEPHAVDSFAGAFESFDEHAEKSDYLVGWHDGFAKDGSLGRGLIHRGLHLGADRRHFDGQDTLTLQRHELPKRFFGVIPRSWLWMGLWFFLNDPGMKIVNAAKMASGRRHARKGRYSQGHAAYHFLLDYVPGWKKAYRPGGLIQFQPFVPAEAAPSLFPELVERLQRAGHPPYLCVTKRHRADPFLMTHGLDGFSMALDLKVTSKNRQSVWALTEELEDLVADRGGRFYFAKDSVLRPRNLARCYPEENLRRFRELKDECDPAGLLRTELYRRLFES